MDRSVGPGAAFAPPELANRASTSDPRSTADRARSRGAFQREFAWLMRIFPPWWLSRWFLPVHHQRQAAPARYGCGSLARWGWKRPPPGRGGTGKRTFPVSRKEERTHVHHHDPHRHHPRAARALPGAASRLGTQPPETSEANASNAAT